MKVRYSGKGFPKWVVVQVTILIETLYRKVHG